MTAAPHQRQWALEAQHIMGQLQTCDAAASSLAHRNIWPKLAGRMSTATMRSWTLTNCHNNYQSTSDAPQMATSAMKHAAYQTKIRVSIARTNAVVLAKQINMLHVKQLCMNQNCPHE